ncbi:hypothetical protein PHBOTO_000276 [Pseudozyma hubeiensis]|nr:hypothetical protein PHBOTO_000276 [Pseudozyma hubeiensis]
MSWTQSTVIDLTEESPPARTHPAPSTLGTDTHILDWSSGSRYDRPPVHSDNRNAASSSSGMDSFRHAAAPIVVGSDDEDDDDNSFTVTGLSAPARSSHPLQRSFSLDQHRLHRSSAGPSPSTTSVRFHDGIGRGPHGAGSRIPQSIGLLSSSASARHPLLPQRRAAIPSTTATTVRRSTNASPDTNYFPRLTEDFTFSGLGYSQVLGNLLRGLHNRGNQNQQSAERKVPQVYDPKWAHPYEVQSGFTHSIVEPPVDLDTYFDDKAVVTGPLPETTPICPCCRRALVTGANGDERIWVLPCGHVIDGRCVDQLSGLSPSTDNVEGADAIQSRGVAKGKAKAFETVEDEPAAKVPRTSARTRATAIVPEAKEATPKKANKPKRFECPVQGCGQKCTKEAGSKYSAWEVFV